jgi:hypothetical protein
LATNDYDPDEDIPSARTGDYWYKVELDPDDPAEGDEYLYVHPHAGQNTLDEENKFVRGGILACAATADSLYQHTGASPLLPSSVDDACSLKSVHGPLGAEDYEATQSHFLMQCRPVINKI